MPRRAYGVGRDGREVEAAVEGGGSRESTVPPVANLVTRARISADLYRRQLRPVPARPGKRVGWELLARYIPTLPRHAGLAYDRGII